MPADSSLDSPSFVVPIDSAENKNNIANFFGNQKKAAKGREEKRQVLKNEKDVETKGMKIEHEEGETRNTSIQEGTEHNAPLPAPQCAESKHAGTKREHEYAETTGTAKSPREQKMQRTSSDGIYSPRDKAAPRPSAKSTKKTRSATSNDKAAKPSPSKAAEGNKKITSFFGR